MNTKEDKIINIVANLLAAIIVVTIAWKQFMPRLSTLFRDTFKSEPECYTEEQIHRRTNPQIYQ